jgi:hypothetical protein|tara:strand:- start:537 stop:770 length:234 start_codon:yes stop_codon:yes gene_type:complete
MSNMTPILAMNRIKAAPKNSPIVVFKSDKPGCVDAMFASTVVSQQRIKSGIDLIGVFDKKSKVKEVYATLENNRAAF